MSNVDHPEHYNKFKHEVIELVEGMGFCQGNALKYILRSPFKGNYKEDLNKAAWYIRRIDAFIFTKEQLMLLTRFADEMERYSFLLSNALSKMQNVNPKEVADDIDACAEACHSFTTTPHIFNPHNKED